MSKLTKEDYQDWQDAIKNTIPLKSTEKTEYEPQDTVSYFSPPQESEEFNLTHDLHGMTIGEAYSFLISLMSDAKTLDIPELRIITGKSGDIRRYFPVWMHTSQFSKFVKSTQLEYTGGSFIVKLWPSSFK